MPIGIGVSNLLSDNYQKEPKELKELSYDVIAKDLYEKLEMSQELERIQAAKQQQQWLKPSKELDYDVVAKELSSKNSIKKLRFCKELVRKIRNAEKTSAQNKKEPHAPLTNDNSFEK